MFFQPIGLCLIFIFQEEEDDILDLVFENLAGKKELGNEDYSQIREDEDYSQITEDEEYSQNQEEFYSQEYSQGSEENDYSQDTDQNQEKNQDQNQDHNQDNSKNENKEGFEESPRSRQETDDKQLNTTISLF